MRGGKVTIIAHRNELAPEGLEITCAWQPIVPEEEDHLFERRAARDLFERVAGDDELALASIDLRKTGARRDDALEPGNVRARHD